MKYKIKFEERCFDDFNDGIEYYDKISQSLADRFYFEFWKTIDAIKDNPQHYQNRYKNIYIAFTETFPFGIHYVVDANLITVITVRHTKRFFS